MHFPEPQETAGDRLRKALLEYQFEPCKATADNLYQRRREYESHIRRQPVDQDQEILLEAERIDIPGWISKREQSQNQGGLFDEK